MASTRTIKKLFEDKGFGFIAPDDGGEGVFAHVKECPELEGCGQGDAVAYDPEWDDRWGYYNATNLKLKYTQGGELKLSRKWQGSPHATRTWWMTAVRMNVESNASRRHVAESGS